MTRNLRAILFGVLGGAALLGAIECTSSTGAPACNALAECCTNPALGGAVSSCLETAQSGELSDASCGQALTMYQQSGQCPFDGGQSDGGQDAGSDATPE